MNTRSAPHAAAPAQPNQSLADGMTVLLQLVSATRPVGSRELARELGFEPTRVNRLLGTLAALGLAERTADRKYAAGPGIHVMAALSLTGSRLLVAALPVLEALRVETGLGAALGVLWRRQVCYLFHASPGRALVQGIAGHSLYAAENSSIGLALLAAETDLRIHARFAGSTVDTARLTRQIAAARAAGYADNEDHSIAVAVASAAPGSVPVAAIALIGMRPGSSLEAAQHLQRAALEIGTRMAAVQ